MIILNLFFKKQHPPVDGIIRVRVQDTEELRLVKEGKTLVNLWKKSDMNSINVYISTQTFVNGTGMIGNVPSKYYKYYAQVLDDGKKVRGTIVNIEGTRCDIKIKD